MPNWCNEKPLTLKEAVNSDYVFCEFKEFGKIEPAKLHIAQAYKNVCEDGFEVELVEFIAVERLGTEEDCEEKSDYGKTWRCWATKPTDEERKAAKWYVD